MRSEVKTLTKKQLFEILDQVPDEALIYVNVEVGDVDRAARDLPAGMTLVQLGLPGDHAIADNAVGLLTWAVTE